MVQLKRSIVLVGLMGAGKTSVGRKLAEALGVGFVDSDDSIVEAAGMSIPDLFAAYGEAEFRALERRVLLRLLGETPQVISTGGGAFIQPEIRAAASEQGVSVWLNVPFEVLWKRVQDKPGRPLLSGPKPKATLRALFDERAPIYRQADVTVTSSEHQGQEAVAQSIIRALIAYGKATPSQETIGKDMTE